MSSIYRHYKNKYYKYIGTAKHSETLEELVVYRCLYDNPLANLWARPRAMFEGEVSTDGQKQRRFAPVSFDIKTVSMPDNIQREALRVLIEKIFPGILFSKIEERLEFKNSQLLLAYCGEELVGFKMGYEKIPGEYYSWLGGVDSGWRSRGVASELMLAQHQWCRLRGYQNISTKTKNSFVEMLILNIRSGFKVVGLEECDPEPKILLKKSLADI